MLAAAGAFLVGPSCFRNHAATPADAPAAHERTALEQALIDARNGEPLPTLADGILIEPLDHRGVRASSSAPWRPRLPVAGTSNAWTVAKVKSTLVADHAVSAGEIQVEVDDSGLVTLRGRVRTPDVAAQAVRDALSTKGVSAVDSYLSW
jgi:hypothetical protein